MMLSRSTFLRLSAATLAAGAVSTIAACGSNSGSSASDAGIRFSWWGADARSKVTQQVIATYQKTNAGVSVKGESTDWSGYWDKLATYTAGKKSPDVIQMDQRYLGEYSGRGALLDLTTQASVLKTADLEPTALQSSQVDGKQYAIPSGINALGIIVNVKLFKDAGLEVPTGEKWTWSEYRALAKDLAAKSKDGVYGAAAVGYEEVWAIQLDGSVYSKDSVKMQASTLAAALAFEKSMIDEMASPSASITSEQTGMSLDQGLFAQNKLGMSPSWSNQLVTYQAASGSDVIMVPLPTQDDGKGNSGIYYKNAMSWSVSTQAKDPAAAAKFIDYLVNDAAAAELFKTDRGVPVNLKVRDAVKAKFTGADLACLNYVELVKDRVTDPIPLMPKGSSDSEQILARTITDVIFGKVTAEQGAKSAIETMTANLKNAK